MRIPNKMIEYGHGGDIYGSHGKKVIDFSANINPLGMPQRAKDAILENIESYCAYPDPFCRELKQAIGSFEKVEERCIVCGNGAADLIYRIVLGLKPQKALLLAPTFSEYEAALISCGCEPEYFLLKEENGFRVKAEIADRITSDIDMVFICNPNNPTGAAAEREVIETIARKCDDCGAVLVLDECFMDFLAETHEYSLKDALHEYKRTVILKAFTKIFAMAGIRLGYLLCADEKICAAVTMAGQPWSVSTVASKCGIAALSDPFHIRKTKEYIKAQRAYLTEEMKKCGIKCFDGKANYILLKTNRDFGKRMRKYGILVRSCENYRGLSEEFFRIAVKTKQENEYFIESIHKEYRLSWQNP